MRQADGAATGGPMKIAVASGKGGTGKTTIAVNLAAVLAEDGHSVVLTDCDVEEPNARVFLRPQIESSTEVEVLLPKVDRDKCTFCGECASICRFHAIAVIADQVLIFPELCHSCNACVLLCPERAMTPSFRPIGRIDNGSGQELAFFEGRLTVGEALAPPVVRAVKKAAPVADIEIFDAPPGTSCPVVETVKGCDYCILVTEPTPFGLNDATLAVGMLRKMGIPFGVVINRSNIGDSAVEDYCGREAIPILARIPHDRNIMTAYSEGDLALAQIPEYRERLLILYESITRQAAA
jgi:MinD superfamily P-loop ATPase